MRQVSADVARISQRVDALLASGDVELRITAQELRATADALGVVARRLNDPRSVLWGPPEGRPRPRRGSMRLAALVALALLAGCFSPGARQPQRFYVLEDPAKSYAAKSTRASTCLSRRPPPPGSTTRKTSPTAARRGRGPTTTTTAGRSCRRAGSGSSSPRAWRKAAASAWWPASVSAVRGELVLSTHLAELYHDAASQPGVVRITLSAELTDPMKRMIVARKTLQRLGAGVELRRTRRGARIQPGARLAARRGERLGGCRGAALAGAPVHHQSAAAARSSAIAVPRLAGMP